MIETRNLRIRRLKGPSNLRRPDGCDQVPKHQAEIWVSGWLGRLILLALAVVEASQISLGRDDA